MLRKALQTHLEFMKIERERERERKNNSVEKAYTMGRNDELDRQIAIISTMLNSEKLKNTIN